MNADYAERFGFHDAENYLYKAPKGLNREIVEKISEFKDEPQWMREFRLKALEHFLARPMPTWGSPLLAEVNFDDIHYFVRASEKASRSWDEVPEDVKKTFDRLGIPEAERKFLAGVGAQYESEVVYHQVREDLEKQGVQFLDMDSGLREHEDLVREYFATVIPANDNKLAALNSAVWSGGSFVYVPPGVHVEMPLQAYFRINTENMGQFERTLIIADEGSYVHYVEGCTAPTYSSDSLHSAVVELIAKPGARIRYTTVQNWSQNVFNLVTKRAIAQEHATVEWVDCNLGCLTAGSMIFTPDRGPVPIEEIREGDEVFGTDLGAMKPVARRVIATRANGIQPTYRLTTANFRSLEATGNHPFLVLDKEPFNAALSVRWRRLENVKVGDYVGVSKGMPDVGMSRFLGDYRYDAPRRSRTKPIQVPVETSEDLMWLLGAYLGDGCIEKMNGRARRVNFAVPPFDPARPRLEKALRHVFGIEGTSKGPYTLALNSSILADFILWLGFGGTATQKRIPSWVFNLPADEKLAFIEGYLDTDGHERKRKVGEDGTVYGQICWTSANRALLEDLKLLLINCGLEPRKISEHSFTTKLRLGKERKTYTSYVLAMNLRGNLDVIRRRVPPPRPVLQFVKVTSLEELPAQPTYDIEVDEIENFTANGIVVHNSKLTMKYPSVYLLGEEAHGEILSIAFAGNGQHQDAGGKIIHAAPRTTSNIFAKSISKDGGRSSYRGLLEVAKGATEARSTVVCDALLLDEESRSDTYPTIRIGEDDVNVGHEATVSKIGEEQLFYLQSHGVPEDEASKMIVNGFIEPITKELPMEYAVEMNRLIELQMEGSIG
ncbi:MAG: Fe-S cluster assembly protein SufB [Actinobacteria bacterium]|nr:Fe-S cluster assembly protein SufB [Actinomycetota bacterium]